MQIDRNFVFSSSCVEYRFCLFELFKNPKKKKIDRSLMINRLLKYFFAFAFLVSMSVYFLHSFIQSLFIQHYVHEWGQGRENSKKRMMMARCYWLCWFVSFKMSMVHLSSLQAAIDTHTIAICIFVFVVKRIFGSTLKSPKRKEIK